MLRPDEGVRLLEKLVKRQCLLPQPAGDEAQGGQPTSELLDVLEALRKIHLLQGFDPLLRDEVSKELAGWHAKGALGQVELHPESSRIGEGFSQNIKEGLLLLGFYNNIIHICVNNSADLLLQVFFACTFGK
jgi:hypothetical protein